jgi:hypothetical protein
MPSELLSGPNRAGLEAINVAYSVEGQRWRLNGPYGLAAAKALGLPQSKGLFYPDGGFTFGASALNAEKAHTLMDRSFERIWRVWDLG